MPHASSLKPLHHHDLGQNVPKRHSKITRIIAAFFAKCTGWQAVGAIPNILKAVLIGVPHTSNYDGLFALPVLLALDLDVKIMGKKQLFRIPVLASFLRWAGVIAIDREKKGSTLNASIERLVQAEQMFIGLAPEGTRDYSKQWKTGFYYLALGANVPILPVAMDYQSKQIRFLAPFYPTGDIDHDLPQLYQYFQHIQPKHRSRLSQPLQDL
ncbi:MAG: 1-acyl-sn-glycerol-3-phosphate acyltransferase [Acinetobacter sp.]|nr:1-acyl-sn-glycerol-3-phosphate acyltransferase [Acinetobacter sp.]